MVLVLGDHAGEECGRDERAEGPGRGRHGRKAGCDLLERCRLHRLERGVDAAPALPGLSHAAEDDADVVGQDRRTRPEAGAEERADHAVAEGAERGQDQHLGQGAVPALDDRDAPGLDRAGDLGEGRIERLPGGVVEGERGGAGREDPEGRAGHERARPAALARPEGPAPPRRPRLHDQKAVGVVAADHAPALSAERERPGRVRLREPGVEPADLLAVGRDGPVVAPAAEHAEELLPVRPAEDELGGRADHEKVAVGRGEALGDQVVEDELDLVPGDGPERPEAGDLLDQCGPPGPPGPPEREHELLRQHVVRPGRGRDRFGFAPRGRLDRAEREHQVGWAREHEREPRGLPPPAGPAEPLEKRRHRGRRAELDHEVQVADVDPELEGRGAGDAERLARLRRVLGRLPHGRRDRGVVAVEGRDAPVEEGREPLHVPPRRGEDQGAATPHQPDDRVAPARLVGLDREREPPWGRGGRELDELLPPARPREPGQHVARVADRGREADPLHGPTGRAVEPVEHGPHLDPAVGPRERVHLVDHHVPQRREAPGRRGVVEQDLERLGRDEQDVRLVVRVAPPLRGRDVAVERGGREPARQAEPLDAVELVVDQGLQRREVDAEDAGRALPEGPVHDRDQRCLGLAPGRRRDHEEVGPRRGRPAGLFLERAQRTPAEPLEQGHLERAVQIVVRAGHGIQVRGLGLKGDAGRDAEVF